MANKLNQIEITEQRGNTFIGILIGLILGLGIALGVAYVIQKNPPAEKTNVRLPDLEAITKPTGTDSEVPDVNQPLKSKNKSSDNADADPVAAIVKSNEPVLPSTPATTSASASASATATAADMKDIIYWLQLGAFGEKDTAERQKATFALQGVQTKVVEGKSDGQPIWRLRIGPFKTESELQTSRASLESTGITYSVIKANK